MPKYIIKFVEDRQGVISPEHITVIEAPDMVDAMKQLLTSHDHDKSDLGITSISATL